MNMLKRWRETRRQVQVFKQFYNETQQKLIAQREELQRNGWYTITEGSWAQRAIQGRCYRRNIVQVQVQVR